MSDSDSGSGVGQVDISGDPLLSSAAQPARAPQRQPARQQNMRQQRANPAAPQPQIDPRTVDPLVNEGKAALERNDHTLAELRAMQALQQVPDHLEGLTLLYQIKRRAGAQAGPQIESLLRRIVRKNAQPLWAQTQLALLLVF